MDMKRQTEKRILVCLSVCRHRKICLMNKNTCSDALGTTLGAVVGKDDVLQHIPDLILRS